MNKCIICDEDASNLNDRYFVIPGHIMVPNCYALCDTHRGIQLSFEDFYNEDASRKKLDKDWFVKRQEIKHEALRTCKLEKDIDDSIARFKKKYGKSFKNLAIGSNNMSDKIVVHCPFHFEKTPSLVINKENKTFECLSCSQSGNLEELIKQSEKMIDDLNKLLN